MARLEAKGKEALRGMERIQQLAEEFPQIPEKLLISMDVVREGVRPSAASRLAGRWAFPYAPGYFDYNHEDAQEKEEMTSQGYFLHPFSAYFADRRCFQPLWDSESPYEIRYDGWGRYFLFRDEDLVEEVFFNPRPTWYDRKTSSGKPMPSIIQGNLQETSLKMVPLNSCGYGKDTCLYCNINSSDAAKRGMGLARERTKSEQDIYETLVAALPETPHILRIIVSGGVMLDPHKEAEAYARTLRVAKRAMKDAGIEVPFTVLCQAMEKEDQLMLKEAGAAKLAHDLEVWDPRMFEIICPGKAKHVGQEKWEEAILRAREVMGPGGAYSVFVNGVCLLHPDGYKTEDEDFEQYVEGLEWMLSHGIETWGVHMRPAPGTMFEGMDPPRTEYFLRCSLALYELEIKYPVRSKVQMSRPDLAIDGLGIRTGLRIFGLQGESRPPEKAGC